jgi:hypothetical protein
MMASLLGAVFRDEILLLPEVVEGGSERGTKPPGIPFPIIHATPLATFDLSPSIAE